MFVNTMPHSIDFNADLGEGCPNDAGLMQLVTSVNIACGVHAGSPAIMLETLRQAKALRLRIGAHPGYADREHFGRQEMNVTPEELYAIVLYQIGALQQMADSLGTTVSYVKPHGGMYHQCSREQALAKALVAAAQSAEVAVMGLPGSELECATYAARLCYIKEGFADRRYLADGSLVPRKQPNAILRDPEKAAAQVRWLIENRGVHSICVHGDEVGAVDFIKNVKAHLGRVD